eukprot:TRINITY_DN748_c0_g1_i6.p1 TRINITY_DN748_c0_g1~~TRINITY_DN748_c0_g1_i6.p1  ORF type:complete len:517 (+),score=83.61 TRINITY_DN748_c0_g1_i6:394-1944(+)
MQTFMTKSIVLQRQSAKVEQSTYSGTEESLLRFLGYCHFVHRVRQPDLSQFENVSLVQQYLDWLLETRELQPKTVGQCLTTAIHVLQFLHSEHALPNHNYQDIPNVQLLRQLRRQVQALVKPHPPTHEQLASMQRWLPWQQIVGTLQQLRSEYTALSMGQIARARLLMKFLMVAFYVYFPPVRAGPIRELELAVSLVQVDGVWHLDLRKYKTFKKYGPVITELHSELLPAVNEYVGEHGRVLLLKTTKHQHVFMNSKGTPFSKSTWTVWLQNIFAERNQGQRISANLLRDSFVTYVYSQNVSDRLKQSIAASMGHTVQTAERQYNRATAQERRQAGLDLASQFVATLCGEPQQPDLPQERHPEGQQQKQPLEEEVFAVERLLAKRRFKGHVQYLVQWTGYGPEANSWTNESDILDKQLIAAFVATEQEGKTRPEVATREARKQKQRSTGKRQRSGKAAVVYEVERVVRTRTGPHGTEYLVKWLGYSSKDNTWEPESSFQPTEEERELTHEARMQDW